MVTNNTFGIIGEYFTNNMAKIRIPQKTEIRMSY